MASPLRISALGAALCGLGMAACAGIVGADFGDVHGIEDAGTTIAVDSGGSVIQPTPDAGPKPVPDSGPIIVADGGTCPTGLTACPTNGVDTCVDLTDNPDHCHACGTACPSDPHGEGSTVCTSSGCTYSCGTGYVLCTGGAGCCAVPVVEAGADTGTPTPVAIPCGTTPCSPLSGGFCCGANNDSQGDVCGTANTADTLNCDYQFFCGSADQCATGQVCCYDSDQYDPQDNPTGQESTCQASACPNNGTDYLQFCNPATSGSCPTGTACTGSFTGHGDLQTTYRFCQ